MPASQDAAAAQEDVFHDLRPLVDATLSGTNAAIIMYGKPRTHARLPGACLCGVVGGQ